MKHPFFDPSKIDLITMNIYKSHISGVKGHFHHLRQPLFTFMS